MREAKEETLKRRALKAYKAKASSDDNIGDILAFEESQKKKKKKKKKSATGPKLNQSTPQLKRQLSDQGKALLNEALSKG